MTDSDTFTSLLTHPTLSILAGPLAIAVVLLIFTQMFFRASSDFSPAGKHCYITGGSTGLGLELAKKLAQQGAHVTIVARKQATLEAAVEAIKAARQSPEQCVQWISADVAHSEQATKALHTAKAGCGGRTPEYVFTCAGLSYPKYFVTQSIEEFDTVMKINYMGTLYTMHEATRLMVAEQIKGKLVMVSSTLGFLGFAGYTQYAPTKHAVRALAETLRHELLLYGIGVHCHFPGNIETPGYQTENETKPAFTRELDGDDIKKPDVVAEELLSGLRKGNFFIAGDLNTNLLRTLASGSAPGNNVIIDSILGLLAWPIMWGWRWTIDRRARQLSQPLAQEHRQMLQEHYQQASQDNMQE